LEKNAISAGRIAQPPHSRVQFDFIEPNFVEVFLLFGWCRKQVIEFAGGGRSLLRTGLTAFCLLFGLKTQNQPQNSKIFSDFLVISDSCRSGPAFVIEDNQADNRCESGEEQVAKRQVSGS
jgi:hypothetical protein